MLEHDVQWLAKLALQNMCDQLQNRNRQYLGPR